MTATRDGSGFISSAHCAIRIQLELEYSADDFWETAMGWVTFESGAGGLWEYVSLCESHEYVARLYAEYHGAAADEDKIREITASFAQGRMYFENARTGSIGVKPLLLYYGILALCGGLVL